MVSCGEECGLWVFVYKACKKGDNFSKIKEKGRKKKKCVKVTDGKFKEHKKQNKEQNMWVGLFKTMCQKQWEEVEVKWWGKIDR